MEGWPKRAWGKLLVPEGGGVDRLSWHPLVDHCADVAACLEALLLLPSIGRRVAALAGLPMLDEVSVARLAAMAFLHDIGKCNMGFQNKAYKATGRPLPLGEKYAGHTREVLGLFQDSELRRRALSVVPLDDMLKWTETPEQAGCLLVAAFSHHGTPLNVRDRNAARAIWCPGESGYDPFASLEELGGGLRRHFGVAFDMTAPCLRAPPALQHAFAGLVMLADWLGSHTAFFPYSEIGESCRMSLARSFAQTALSRVGLDTAPSRRAFAPSREFGKIFMGRTGEEYSPNPVQQAATAAPNATAMILEAETGSGKTEAALWRFRELFAAGLVDGLYFALPTRVAAQQIHGRVRAAVARLFPSDDAPPVLLAVPGYVQVDDAKVVLPGFTTLWSDSPDECEAHRRWAAENPKRFLAAQIAVGTIDQALMGNLQIRHAHLRAAALMRHLLIVDEVHASDAYMTALLRNLLDVHLRAGGHALLMSATLGASARRRLLTEAGDPPPSLAAAIATPYPAITLAENGGERVLAIDGSGPDKTVRITCLPALERHDMVACLALQAARDGAKVMVVRNTVRSAVAAQRCIESMARADDHALLFSHRGVVTLHHGRFARREDRRRLGQTPTDC